MPASLRAVPDLGGAAYAEAGAGREGRWRTLRQARTFNRRVQRRDSEDPDVTAGLMQGQWRRRGPRAPCRSSSCLRLRVVLCRMDRVGSEHFGGALAKHPGVGGYGQAAMHQGGGGLDTHDMGGHADSGDSGHWPASRRFTWI